MIPNANLFKWCCFCFHQKTFAVILGESRRLPMISVSRKVEVTSVWEVQWFCGLLTFRWLSVELTWEKPSVSRAWRSHLNALSLKCLRRQVRIYVFAFSCTWYDSSLFEEYWIVIYCKCCAFLHLFTNRHKNFRGDVLDFGPKCGQCTKTGPHSKELLFGLILRRPTFEINFPPTSEAPRKEKLLEPERSNAFLECSLTWYRWLFCGFACALLVKKIKNKCTKWQANLHKTASSVKKTAAKTVVRHCAKTWPHWLQWGRECFETGVE